MILRRVPCRRLACQGMNYHLAGMTNSGKSIARLYRAFKVLLNDDDILNGVSIK